MASNGTRNEAAYAARTPASRAHFERARATLPQGVGARGKYLSPHPLYVRSGSGSRIEDVDGNEYLDLHLASGCLILGHAHPAVQEAVTRQLQRGLALGLATELEAELAERVTKHMPHVERLRYATTGSEATNMAVRVARAYTGRSRVAKFEGHFHGHAHDALLASTANVAGTKADPLPAHESAGLGRNPASELLLLSPDDCEATIERIVANAHDLAAVILEPAPLNSMPTLAPDPELISRLRDVTTKHGVLLIFDEVFTCFRLGLGGGSARFGVRPDLVALGKVIGGGLPLAAFGGRADVMDATLGVGEPAPDQPRSIFQSGTFSGHPLALAAGLATLTELERSDPYAELERKAEAIRLGLADVCERLGIAASASSVGSHFQIYFGVEGPIRDRRTILGSDRAFQREFCLGMICGGVYWTPGSGALVSTAHSAADAERVIETAGDVLAEQVEYMELRVSPDGVRKNIRR
ncbi:MAG: aspartate aminotransferase family protein [Gaiellaceae bacterium]